MANERPPMRMMGRGGPPPHERMLMAEKPKNTKGTLKRLVGYIGKNRYLMILLFIRYADNHCAEPCRSLSSGSCY